jgi:hypothetical protein
MLIVLWLSNRILDIFTWKRAINSITFVSMAPQNVDDVVVLEVCQHRAPQGVAAGVRFRVGADMVEPDVDEGNFRANQGHQIPPVIAQDG